MKNIVCLFVCLFAGSANANLLTNGDFSTGDISGWTLSGGEYSTVEAGVFREFDNSGWAILSQDIFTNSGVMYDISFDTFASQISGNDFAWAIDGGVLNYITTTTSWVTNTGTFTGTGGNTNVAFYMATDPGTGTWRLDNISVTAGESVPEPNALALLGLGLAGIAFSRKKKTT
jgi:hypothetical protein